MYKQGLWQILRVIRRRGEDWAEQQYGYDAESVKHGINAAIDSVEAYLRTAKTIQGIGD